MLRIWVFLIALAGILFYGISGSGTRDSIAELKKSEKVESGSSVSPEGEKSAGPEEKVLIHREGPETEGVEEKAERRRQQVTREVELRESDAISGHGEAEDVATLEPYVPESEMTPEPDEQHRFSKLDKSGKLLPPDAEAWSCVLDAETELVWEVKTQDSSIHSANNRFVWFDPAVPGGVFSGNPVSKASCTFFDEEVEMFCNTHQLALALDTEKLCGFSEWRLPSVKELNSIVVNRGSASVVDKTFFPNTQSEYHWTSDAVAYQDRRAWAVLFRYRAAKNDIKKGSPVYARLVAGGL